MISIFLVEYMNRITFGASDLALPFFTPGVFFFKISMLFDAIKLSHISSCKQLHMYNIYILMVACVYTVFVYMRIDASVCVCTCVCTCVCIANYDLF